MGSLISPSLTTMSCLSIVLLLVLASSSHSRSLSSTLPHIQQPTAPSKDPTTAPPTTPSPSLEATPWYPAYDMEATPFGPKEMEEYSITNVNERRGLEDFILEIR